MGGGGQKRVASKVVSSLALCDIYFSINSWHLYYCDRSISLSQCSSPLTLSFNYLMVLLSPWEDCKRNIYNFELPRSRAGETFKCLVWIISSPLDDETLREFSFFSSLLNSDSYTIRSKGTEPILNCAVVQGFQNDSEKTRKITESQSWKGPYITDGCVSQDPWLQATDLDYG